MDPSDAAHFDASYYHAIQELLMNEGQLPRPFPLDGSVDYFLVHEDEQWHA
jgi:hypothetical protein